MAWFPPKRLVGKQPDPRQLRAEVVAPVYQVSQSWSRQDRKAGRFGVWCCFSSNQTGYEMSTRSTRTAVDFLDLVRQGCAKSLLISFLRGSQVAADLIEVPCGVRKWHGLVGEELLRI